MIIQCQGGRVVGRPTTPAIEAPAPPATTAPAFYNPSIRHSKARIVDVQVRAGIRDNLMVACSAARLGVIAQPAFPAALPAAGPARLVSTRVASPIKESITSSFPPTFTTSIPNTLPASIAASLSNTLDMQPTIHLQQPAQQQLTAQAHLTQPERQQYHEQQPQQADAPAASNTPAAAVTDINDPELYEEIKACKLWQDVLEIIEDEAPDVSLFSAVQALSKLTALARTSPHGFARTCAQIKAAPSFNTLLQLLATGVPRMRRAQLCNSLQSLAQIRVELPDTVLAEYAQRAQQLAPELNSRDIAALMHGWATMGRRPSLATLDLIGFKAKALLEAGEMEGQALSMFMHSLAQLDYCNHQLLRAACVALVLQLPQMTPQGVANCSWALGKLGHFSFSALAAAEKAYLAAPEAFKPLEACNVLWAMTRHRYHPSQEMLSAMVKSLVKRSAQLRPADYAVVFSAFGMFCVHPGNQLLSELLNAMSKQLARFCASELCEVYWGLGLIGETRQPVCHQIAALLPDHYEANRMDAGLLRQTFQAFLCGKLADAMEPSSSEAAAPKRAASVSFPPMMMDAMKRAWVLSQQAKASQEAQPSQQEAQQGKDSFGVVSAQTGDSTSQSGETTGKQAAAQAARKRRPKIKQEVAELVKLLRIPHEVSRVTRDGVATIDVALKAGERFIALQVVMEHEHTCNTGQFLGPLQFQRQVLEMNGWEVRHVLAKDLKALDRQNKPRFMADLLRGMGIRVRGFADGPQPGRRPQTGSRAGAVSGLDLVLNEGGPGPRRR